MRNKYRQGDSKPPQQTAGWLRVLSVALGVQCYVFGVLAVMDMPDHHGWRILAGVVLFLLGSDAIHAAWRGRSPVLLRLGPLP